MNRLWISGVVIETKPLRVSPAGVPIGEALIEHREAAELTTGPRELTCEVIVQASGTLAETLARLPSGARVKLEGALNRKSLHSRQLIVVLNRIEKE